MLDLLSHCAEPLRRALQILLGSAVGLSQSQPSATSLTTAACTEEQIFSVRHSFVPESVSRVSASECVGDTHHRIPYRCRRESRQRSRLDRVEVRRAMSRRKQAKPRALKREDEFVIFTQNEKGTEEEEGASVDVSMVPQRSRTPSHSNQSTHSDSADNNGESISSSAHHNGDKMDCANEEDSMIIKMGSDAELDSELSDELEDDDDVMEEDEDEEDEEEEEGEIYKCDSCNETFTSLTKFMDHRNTDCAEDGEMVYKLSQDGTEAFLVGHQDMDLSSSDQFETSPGAIQPYACQFCDKSFSRLTYLKKHEQVHSEQMPWKCSFCSRLFKHKRSRDRHVKLHTGDKKYQCHHCQAAFARSDHLKIHVKTHNSNKPFQCIVCNRGYTTAAGLTAHSHNHHKNVSTSKDKEFKCLQCSLSFNSSQDLQNHIMSHDGSMSKERVMQCSYCAELFPGKEALLGHIEKAHGHDKRNKCPICTECFQTVDFLYDHMSTHSQADKMKYKCPYCPKQEFPSIAVLNIHLQTMHTDKPVQSHRCQYCSEDYPSLVTLNEHMKNAHHKEGMLHFACQYCTMEFNTEAMLELHVRNVHAITAMADKWFCQQCTMGFASEVALQEHLENVHNASHSAMFSCDSCMKVYTSQQMLDEHVEKTHRKPLDTMKYPCPYCIEQNLFNSIEELQMHVEIQHRKEGNIVVATPDGESASVHSNSETIESDIVSASTGKGKEIIQCPDCQQNFKDLEQLQTHLKTHMESTLTGPNSCTYCNLEFATEEEMQKHIVSHFVAVNVEYCCQSCSKSFLKPDELQKHLFDIHAHHLYKCSMCKEVFDSKVSVQVHFAIKHSNEYKLFKCTKCGVVFRKESDLHLHIRMDHLHHSTRMYRCLFCHMAFHSEVEFQCHLTTHKKQFECGLCDAAFPTQQMLDIHSANKHSNSAELPKKEEDVASVKVKTEPESELDSPRSEVSIARSSSREGTSEPGKIEQCQSQEMLTIGYPHTISQQKPVNGYPCDVCGAVFSVKILLENHQILEHSAQLQGLEIGGKIGKDTVPISGTLFQCPMCMKTFTSSINLQSHLGAHLLEMEQQKMLIAKRTASFCSICKDMIISETDFLSHAQRHNNEKSSTTTTIDCVVCLQSLTSMAALQLHARYHTQSQDAIKMYQCFNCQTNFDSTHSLTVVLDAGGKPSYCCQDCQSKVESCREKPIFRCPRCKIKFESQAELDSHMLSHMQEKTYQCIKCQKTFSTEKEIQIHVTTHMIEEGVHHECKLCQQVFDSPAKLQCHLIEHTYPDKQYTCHLCEALFSCAADIQTHAIEHGMDARQFVCNQCPQTFFFEAELQNHALTHGMTDLMPSPTLVPSITPTSPQLATEFQCTECARIFSSNTNLQNHMKIHAAKDKTFKCSLCPEVFSTTVDMQQHYFRTHSESELGVKKKTYKCAQCGKVFPCMSNLQGHMRIHTQGKKYPCAICNKVFALARNLTIHMRSHSGEKPYQCPLCDKRFARKENRKVHLKAHSGLKPFMCPHCGKMFSRKCHVKDHMRTHSNAPVTFGCSMCEEDFVQISELQKHVRQAHSKDKTKHTQSKVENGSTSNNDDMESEN
ncbi:zinc finger protein 423-like [Ptychodera flava]|uniref:zinc finger protein 423-like n=1 Tax=Ptychodera flava TaxID=63121 RepID=UPI003969C55F